MGLQRSHGKEIRRKFAVCVDYRQLNERTVKDSYPLPRIDVCLEEIAGATWFSMFDRRSGYHQVEMDSKDTDKTTFVTRGEVSGSR